MLWQDMYTNLSFTNSVHTARNMIRWVRTLFSHIIPDWDAKVFACVSLDLQDIGLQRSAALRQ
jgi:hypothetical protein